MRKEIQDYCNAHPECIDERCSLSGNYPCSDDSPREWEYTCGNQDKPRCPFIEKFSSALKGKYVKYISDEKTGFTAVGYVTVQCPERVYVAECYERDAVVHSSPIDPDSIIEVLDEKNYKCIGCDSYDCGSCILRHCCTASYLYRPAKK